MSAKGSVLNTAFWFHLFITLLAWSGAFLFSWQLMVIAHLIVQMQFWVLGRCVVNKHHELDESDNYTFYAFLFESVGIYLNRDKLKWFIRNVLHTLLALLAVVWQVVLGYEPLLF